MSPPVDATRSSIVAYYGALHDPLAALVARLQDRVDDLLGPAFSRRPAAQVHATVIGLETPVGPGSTGDRTRFDAGPLAAHLVRTFTGQPLTVQFGGFAPADRRLLSRGSSLHERTFLVGPSDVVLIGWPVGTGGAPLPALAQVRRSCEPFGARHRYHAGPGAGDPDAYLVVGRTESADEGRRAAVQEIVRHELVDAPVRVPMCAADLSLVEYADTALPPASTRRHPLVGG